MNAIILPATVLLVTGILLGMLLGFADKFLKVEEDPRLEKLIALLPGYNCGVCGYPGCSGFASAVLEKNDRINDCKPLKGDARDEVTELLKP